MVCVGADLVNRTRYFRHIKVLFDSRRVLAQVDCIDLLEVDQRFVNDRLALSILKLVVVAFAVEIVVKAFFEAHSVTVDRRVDHIFDAGRSDLAVRAQLRIFVYCLSGAFKRLERVDGVDRTLVLSLSSESSNRLDNNCEQIYPDVQCTGEELPISHAQSYFLYQIKLRIHFLVDDLYTSDRPVGFEEEFYGTRVVLVGLHEDHRRVVVAIEDLLVHLVKDLAVDYFEVQISGEQALSLPVENLQLPYDHGLQTLSGMRADDLESELRVNLSPNVQVQQRVLPSACRIYGDSLRDRLVLTVDGREAVLVLREVRVVGLDKGQTLLLFVNGGKLIILHWRCNF